MLRGMNVRMRPEPRSGAGPAQGGKVLGRGDTLPRATPLVLGPSTVTFTRGHPMIDAFTDRGTPCPAPPGAPPPPGTSERSAECPAAEASADSGSGADRIAAISGRGAGCGAQIPPTSLARTALVIQARSSTRRSSASATRSSDWL